MKSQNILRKTVLLVMVFLSSFTLKSQCDFTIDLLDTFGDGWNGGVVNVDINGVNVLSGLTVTTGFGPASFTITGINPGDVVDIIWIAGGFPNENYYQLYDSFGTLVYDSGAGVQPPGTFTFVGTCSPPIFGCTNSLANNYNPAANFDDGSCLFNGTDCSSPFVIGSLPFSGTGLSTVGMGNDYGPGDACGSFYMSGNDFVFEYTATATTCITAILDNTAGNSGIFLLDGCPDAAGTTCIAFDEQLFGDPDANINLADGAQVIAGQTYYIVVSTDGFPNDTNFDIDVDAVTCPVFGCTVPSSPNYDPTATVNDGSCLPPPCDPSLGEPGNDCDSVPFFTSIGGLCGTSWDDTSPGPSPVPGSPNPWYDNNDTPGGHGTTNCGGPDNTAYIPFQADAATLEVIYWVSDNPLYPGDCAIGIQVQVYELAGSDCNAGTWVPVGPCDNALGGNGFQGNIFITGLTPGNYYVIYIDGWAGETCDYVFAVNGVFDCEGDIGDFPSIPVGP